MKSSAFQWGPRVVLLIALATFIGCSHPGSEFVGHWVSKTQADSPIEISRNGDQFLFIEGKHKLGAVYANGSLELSVGPAIVRLTYVKSSDTLLTPDGEYQRAP